MSIGGILSTAAQALITHQKALAVTSHNISNAQTEGYSRQRAVLQATDPLITPDGVIGRGVTLAQVDRVRDPLLDDVYRRETSSTSYHGERTDQLRGIEEIFGEPSETGLLATLDAFWGSWSDLAADPLSDAARSVVRERATELGDRFQQLVSGLDDQRAAGERRVVQLVGRVNELADQVADMNRRIVAAESGGGEAGDLRDSRDRALDELSSLVEIRVVHRDAGDVGVYLQGQALVDGITTRTLETVESTDPVTGITGISGIGFENASAPLRVDDGRLGGTIPGLISVLRGSLSSTKAELVQFARDFATAVNDLHSAGVPPSGLTTPGVGENFFAVDAAGEILLDGGRPVLTDKIQGDIQAIAAGSGDGSGGYLAGTNDVALAIQDLREGSPSFGERYSTLVTTTGSKVASAESSREVHDTLARGANARRDEVSGVAIDEELAGMIQQQAAYGAAARVVTRVDEMLQTLIGMV